MKLETNENGKIVLFRKDTGKEVLFDFQIDAREALLQIDKKTGDSVYVIPEKKKKFSAPIIKKEEVGAANTKENNPEPSKGLKVGRGRPAKVKEVIEEVSQDDAGLENDSEGTLEVEQSKFEE